MISPNEAYTKALFRYLTEHQEELDNGADENELIQRFTKEYNASLQSGSVDSRPKTADDYLNLAEGARTKKQRLNYLDKAAKLEPDNLDVATLIAETKATTSEDLLDSLSELIKKGTAQLEEEGCSRTASASFGLLSKHVLTCACATRI